MFKQLLISCAFSLCLLMTLTACVTANSAAPAGNSSSGNFSGAGVSVEPGWVRDPYTKYDRQANVAAVGSASSRDVAEKNAFGSLIAIFGQSIHVDEKVAVSYQEAVKNGVTAHWSENTAVDSIITSSTSLDSLVGAEIGDVWNDGRNYYAVAVLNKARAARTYSGIVSSNQKMIDNLIGIPLSEKNTLGGYARYQFAATIADVTLPYVNLLSVIAGPVEGYLPGDAFRLEAAGITKAIPVAIRVRNDAAGRVQGAFAKAVSGLGFQSGGNSSRYALNVEISAAPVEIANNQFRWARIAVNADLVDTSNGTVLLPYNFSLREGHTTQTEAENRAIMSAERKIGEEYGKLLGDYLSRLLPE